MPTNTEFDNNITHAPAAATANAIANANATGGNYNTVYTLNGLIFERYLDGALLITPSPPKKKSKTGKDFEKQILKSYD